LAKVCVDILLIGTEGACARSARERLQLRARSAQNRRR